METATGMMNQDITLLLMLMDLAIHEPNIAKWVQVQETPTGWIEPSDVNVIIKPKTDPQA